MSRYRGPRFKLIRRLGLLPGLTVKRLRARKKKTPTKKTQYRLRLEEKQKLRFHYGVSERQLLRYVRSARRSKGSTGETLLQYLEMRLDNIVFRAGLATTIPAARQLVNHGHIRVNQSVVDIPSYRCCLKDQIDLSALIHALPALKNKNIIARNVQRTNHLKLRDKTVAIQSIVDRKDIGVKVNELLVVEYYSRQA